MFCFGCFGFWVFSLLALGVCLGVLGVLFRVLGFFIRGFGLLCFAKLRHRNKE